MQPEPDRFTVGPEQHRIRIDRYLLGNRPDLGRGGIDRLLRTGRVRVGGRRRGPGTYVKRGDRVEIDLAPASPSPGPPALIHHSPSLLVVAKPPGVPTTPTGGGPGGLLALLRAQALLPEGVRPGIVHRLDRDASGLLLLSLAPGAHRLLLGAFRGRTLRKRYLALVEGSPRPACGRIDHPLRRAGSGRVRIDPDGLPARTRYRTIGRLRGASLLEVEPETGRMHQIRVHLAGAGHPILGDSRYGRSAAVVPPPRLWLHAREIRLPRPLAEEVRVPRRLVCPLWPDLADHLERLGIAYEAGKM